MHPPKDPEELRKQIAYLRRMAALISDPDTAISLLEIALQFEEQLAASDTSPITELARQVMARRMRRRVGRG